MLAHKDDVNVDALLNEIREIAQQQTELTLNIADGLLQNSKSIIAQVRFDSLDEANEFLTAKREDVMNYVNQLHELIASCYLDDLIGQKIVKVQKALNVSVSSKLAGDMDIKKIEIDSTGLDLSSKVLAPPFRQQHLM